MQKKVYGIVVTYYFKNEFKKNVNLFLNELDFLYIIDNGSSNKHVNYLKELKNNKNNIHLQLNKFNFGLAKAQNLALKLMKNKNPDWVFFFDQDSKPKKNLIKNLLEHSKKYNTELLGPKILEQKVKRNNYYLIKKNNFKFKRTTIDNDEIKNNAYNLVSSGSIIKYKVFKEIGLFRENFFIDYIDLEFSLRARQRNYRISIVNSASLFHELGSQTKHNFCGFTIFCHNYNKERRYTIGRNRFFYMRIFAKSFPGIIKIEVLATFYDIFRILIFEKNSIEKINYLIKGILHGIFKKIPPISHLK